MAEGNQDNTWQKTADRLAQLLEEVTPATVAKRLPKELIELLAEAATENNLWSANRRVFTFGQLDPDKCILLCRAGHLPWWMPFTGRVVGGDLAGAEKLHDALTADAGKGAKPTFNSVLTWTALPTQIAPGVATKRSPEMIRQVLKWGANVNCDSGKWLEEALRMHEHDCLKAFLEGGADSVVVRRVMEALHREQNFTQLGRVQEALSRRMSYKVDADTLMEERYVADMKGGVLLKTLFNFGARRVQEIYEAAPAPAVINTLSFADYDSATLAKAYETLVRLGGTPRTLEPPPEKPRMAKPAPSEAIKGAGGN